MHPVVRAAFKAVELLIKWLEGSTPSSSADINLNTVELFLLRGQFALPQSGHSKLAYRFGRYKTENRFGMRVDVRNPIIK